MDCQFRSFSAEQSKAALDRSRAPDQRVCQRMDVVQFCLPGLCNPRGTAISQIGRRLPLT